MSEVEMHIDAEQRKRYHVLFKYLEHKCPVVELASFTEAFSETHFASSDSYIKRFLSSISQIRSNKICRDIEIMALLSLASVWMVCHPPAAVKYLEHLIELQKRIEK